MINNIAEIYTDDVIEYIQSQIARGATLREAVRSVVYVDGISQDEQETRVRDLSSVFSAKDKMTIGHALS